MALGAHHRARCVVIQSLQPHSFMRVLSLVEVAVGATHDQCPQNLLALDPIV